MTPMSRKTVYVVRKNGLYLMSYRKSDIREFDGHGKLTDVYTGVYGDGRKGAKAFKHKAMALEVMRMIDGDSVEEVFAEVDDDADESRA